MSLVLWSNSVVIMNSMVDKSIWVSNLQTPLSAIRIRDHFARFGEIKDVFIQSTWGDSCLILFASEESALTSLTYDQSCWDGKRIRVDEPTRTQMHWYQDSKTRHVPRTEPANLESISNVIGTLPDADIATLMERLVQVGQARFNNQPSQPVESNTPGRNSNCSRTPHSPLQFAYSGAPSSYMEQPMVYGIETQNVPTHSFDNGTSHHNAPPVMGHRMEQQPPVSFLPYPPAYFPPAPTQSPRIVFFSGDSGKAEHGSYQQWRHEVHCLINERQSQASILQAMRRSLKGSAAEALLNLGPQASCQQILDKFDVIYGNVLSSDTMLENFFTARQAEKETAATWGCRLESLLKQAKEKGVETGNSELILRKKFWRGLNNPELKNALRHRVDAGESFMQLLVATRTIEHEMNLGKTDDHGPTSKKKAVGTMQAQTAAVQAGESKMDQLMQTMQEMSMRLKKLEERKQSNPPNPSSSQGAYKPMECFYCHKPGHMIKDCLALQRKQQQQQQPPRQQTQSTPSVATPQGATPSGPANNQGN